METRVAIPVWRGNVSSVCDFSRHFLLVDVRGRREISRRDVYPPDETAVQRVTRLNGLGAKVLICGAISRVLAWFVTESGILLLPFVAGPVEHVLAAYLCGRLWEPRFLLPGSTPAARKAWDRGREFSSGTLKSDDD